MNVNAYNVSCDLHITFALSVKRKRKIAFLCLRYRIKSC